MVTGEGSLDQHLGRLMAEKTVPKSPCFISPRYKPTTH